jgi:L-asparagine transporter-like permease
MRFKTIFWLIPEVITSLLILVVFVGMFIEEDFSWKFVLLLISLIGLSINTYKRTREILKEDKEYDPRI